MSDQTGEGERAWLYLEEVQQLLPPGIAKRWISEEAKRLGVYRMLGKKAVILKAGLSHFLLGEVWRESAAKTSTSGLGARKARSMPQSCSHSRKADVSSTVELNAVRERLTGGKRRNSQKP